MSGISLQELDAQHGELLPEREALGVCGRSFGLWHYHPVDCHHQGSFGHHCDDHDHGGDRGGDHGDHGDGGDHGDHGDGGDHGDRGDGGDHGDRGGDHGDRGGDHGDRGGDRGDRGGDHGGWR